MSSKKLNVLVYAGTGSSVESVRHCVYSLRRLLSPNYAVLTINGDTLIKEPWTQTCALLVFPGGGDLGYCRTLDGAGNRRIRQYVHSGGSYLGFCAGGYYGSSRCEFEVGNDELEVVGKRELGFFPGTCRGSAFKGFKYGSEAGTRAAELLVHKTAFGSAGILPEVFRAYQNGGSVFVDADALVAKGIQILASYAQKLDVEGGSSSAAIVYCKAGEGDAILTGPHPEFAAVNLRKDAKDMDPTVVDALRADDQSRALFFRSCLLKLGLDVNEEEQTIPALSPLHLTSNEPASIARIAAAWSEVITAADTGDYIKAEQDTFLVKAQDSAWSMTALTRAALDLLPSTAASSTKDESADMILDYTEIIKPLIAHTNSLPTSKDTPYFSHEAYFTALDTYSAESADSRKPSATTPIIGNPLLYGQVVTSTSTLLEKNTKLTSTLPSGTVFTVTTQLSGRGRGSNVWLSPAGSLMFSFILRHPLILNVTAPVVFVQYLAAMAIAEGIRAYGSPNDAYAAMPIKLKWPNDIYARDPRPTAPAGPGTATTGSGSTEPAYVKIGGILVNSSYAGGDYTLVVGIGLNVSNAAPTTSLNHILAGLDPRAEPYTLERLLARVLASFATLYAKFCAQGFGGDLEALYYRHWLHDEQIVTLETEGGARARIKGITTDWGLLRAVEVTDGGGRDGVRETGREFALQTDSNSFDFFRGLVKRKI